MLRVRLNHLLERRGMSQRELARRTDRHPDVISRFAREATGKVSYDLLEDICGTLECDVGDLLEYVPEPDEQMGLFVEDEVAAATAGMGTRTNTHLLRAADAPAQYGTDKQQAGETA